MRSLVLGSLVALAVTMTACGQAVDRLGNEPATPVVLHAETGFNPDEVAAYARQVARATGDLVRLDVAQAVAKTPAVEDDIIERVRSGALDAAFVGTRAWTAYDIHAFDALHAPFLIDSLDLERAVLQSSILDGAGSGLDALGLTSVGLLPGPLRLPGGRERAFTTPASFSGASLAITKSSISDATLAALGAHAEPIVPGGDIAGLDGIEAQVEAMPLEGPAAVGVVTGNVVLWPRPISVVVNKERFASLPAEQQAALRDAIGASMDTMIDGLRFGDLQLVDSACRNGVRFVQASPDDVKALRAAVEPVYASLRSDAATSTAIDAITALRTGTGDSLACPADAATPVAPATVATAIDGTWSACPTQADILAADGLPDEARINQGCTTMTFDRGTFHEDGAGSAGPAPGTYSLKDDHQLVINRANGEQFEFTWSLFEDRLALGPPANAKAVNPAPIRALPWVRRED
jgi:TRAP-type C4-dicarboxylate transport system substrate-binding protein